MKKLRLLTVLSGMILFPFPGEAQSVDVSHEIAYTGFFGMDVVKWTVDYSFPLAYRPGTCGVQTYVKVRRDYLTSNLTRVRGPETTVFERTFSPKKTEGTLNFTYQGYAWDWYDAHMPKGTLGIYYNIEIRANAYTPADSFAYDNAGFPEKFHRFTYVR